MYYITEDDFYKNNLELKALIEDYKQKKEEYQIKKSKQTYFAMSKVRNEICLFLDKIRVESEYSLETENLSLIFLFGCLAGLTSNILNQEYLISASAYNIKNEIREDEILRHAKTLQESLIAFNKKIDELLEVNLQIENTKQNQK